MPVVKTVHIGGVSHNDVVITIKPIIATSRQQLIGELNMWFFDYFHTHKKETKMLPPLDDWTRSHEDHTYWSIIFPETGWLVWIRTEIVEFR